ncbi:MAG: hypothetical protein JWP59_2353 [Massilia sp.]|nr:hypothetical protein [Massilia sp.]
MKRIVLSIALLCAAVPALAQNSPAPAPAATRHTTPTEQRAFTDATVKAAAGDSDAMLRLGEMYWYGDGPPLDREKADTLFRQAAKAGNPGAAAALRLTPERQVHLADIAYWSGGITARQLTGAQFNCEGPAFPPYSDIRVDAVKVVKSYEAYRGCYNNYVEKLFGDLPTARRIPADVALLMSEDEFEQAARHIDKLVASTVADLQRISAPVLAERDRWVERSVAYITTQELRRQTTTAASQMNDRACNGGGHCP